MATSRLNFHLDSQAIRSFTDSIINRSRKVLDKIAATEADNITFKNVIVPMAQMEGDYAVDTVNCYFPQYVSSSKDVRQASMECNKLLEEFSIESDMRQDIYNVVMAVKAKGELLEGEDKRLLEKMEIEYRRNGLALPTETRDDLKVIKKRLSELSIEFSSNMNEDDTKIIFSEEELEGVSHDFLSSLKKTEKDGRQAYILTMKYPDLFGVLKKAKLEDTRRRMEIAYSSKCFNNVALLKEAISLRRKAAKMLGYSSHAAFKLENKMAKNAGAVQVFLEDLQAKLKPLAITELQKLKDLKKKDLESRNISVEGEVSIDSWDFHYYHTKMLENDFHINEDVIKEYFSLEDVTEGMLNIYQEVLGLKFSEVFSSNVWHSDVRIFEVQDSATNELIGQFYLDLFPRDGKYTHAACFGLQPGCLLDEEKRQYPIAAMVANFSKPSADKPSLLKHGEVVTYFHELGHVMHQLCSKTKWSRFHGTKVERDFVEAPSQMLENWCWEANVLARLSNHFERKGEKLPEEIVAKLVQAKNLNAGLLNLRQIFFATYDMLVHTTEDEDIDLVKTWETMKAEITLLPSPPNTWPVASFGHIMGGYDAGYYGYLWSQVFSADMFHSRFKVEGIANPETGLSYRNNILLPGGSKDGGEMLKGFLGREPQSDAFLKSLGYMA